MLKSTTKDTQVSMCKTFPSFYPRSKTLKAFIRKKWFIPGLFFVYFLFITIFTTKVCEKMSIQYTVLGFEPTTFKT